MAMYRKLGKATAPRKAMLRSLTTDVLRYGKVFTTEARAKEVRKQVEKLIALAVREKDNYEMVAVKAKVAKKDADGKRVKEVVDGKKVTVYDEVEKSIRFFTSTMPVIFRQCTCRNSFIPTLKELP